MARTYFAKPAAGMVLVAGTVISDLQTALNASLGGGIDVDGVYGGQTTAAVSRLQMQKGQAVSGDVTDAVWSAAMSTDAPDLFGRCLQVTASFEGTQFTEIVGNFDGAGLTWGIVGFTLEGGELGALLREIDAAYPDIMRQAFGPNEAQIMAATDPAASWADKLAFANSISVGPGKRQVAEPWLTHFRILGGFPEVRHLQVARTQRDYWTTAQAMATALGLSEELDYALLFDVAVQNGSVDEAKVKAAFAAAPGASAAARRGMIAQVVADRASAAYQADVMARKSIFASGTGTAHGGNYDLSRWGLLDGVAAT